MPHARDESKSAAGSDEEEARRSAPKRAKSSGGRSGEAVIRSAPKLAKSGAGRSDAASDDEEDLKVLECAPKTAAKPKGRGNQRSLRVFSCIEDVDDEISRLKKAPRELKKKDFKSEFGLPDIGENPHHFRKNTVPAESLKKLFGKPYGEQGRGGYAWGGCEFTEVQDRVKYLHPILYQHGQDETPHLVTIRFAEGIALEYEEGAGKVNWCAFGEETNKRQRSRYLLDRSKLEELKKVVGASKSVDVRGKEWRGMKVEPSGEMKVKVEPGLQVKTEGGKEGLVKKRGLQATPCHAQPSKSRRVEVAEYDGLGLESGMASGVCTQEHAGCGQLKKTVVAERLGEVELLMEAIHLEQQHSRELKKRAAERVQGATLNCKQSEWGVDSLQKLQIQKKALISTLQEQGQDTFKEIIKMEGLQEQIQEELVKVKAAVQELEEAEVLLAALTRGLQTSELQFDALAAEKFELQSGRTSLNFLPRPMVYSHEDPAPPSRDFLDPSKFIRITVCSLCSFPFPQMDIVVSSCKHLYHPFCASVLFAQNGKCMAEGCRELSHPQWHRSFGWGEPNAELLQREVMLGLAEERRRLIKERMDQARGRLPAVDRNVLGRAKTGSSLKFAIDGGGIDSPVKGKGRASRGRANAEGLSEPLVMECSDDVKSVKSSEPDLDLESDSSEDKRDVKMPRLPSRSGTTISSSGTTIPAHNQQKVEDVNEDDVHTKEGLANENVDVEPEHPVPEQPSVEGGFVSAAPAGECALSTRKLPAPEIVQKSAVVFEPGSECLRGRRGKDMGTDSKKNDIEGSAKGLEDGVPQGAAALDSKQAPLEETMEEAAVEAGAEPMAAPPKSPFKCNAKRVKGAKGLEEGGFVSAAPAGECALSTRKLPAPEMVEKSAVVSKPGSECLRGRRGKDMGTESKKNDIAGNAKGLEDGVPQGAAALDSKQAPAKETVGEAAVEEGAEPMAAPPKSPFKCKARRVKGPSVSDDEELSNVLAPENLYCPDKRTFKDLSELARGKVEAEHEGDSPVSGRPKLPPESAARTRARAAKELDAGAVTKVTGKKGKGEKVGGSKRRR